MKIGICVPFHLRGGSGSTIAPNFRHLSRLPYTVVFAGSEGSVSAEFAKPYLNATTHYVEVTQARPVTNNPGGDAVLRKKYNDTLVALGQIDWFNWYCMVGANDIIHPLFFEQLTEHDPEQRAVVAGISSVQPIRLLDLPTGRSCALHIGYARSVKFLPGVNAFSFAALDSCAWRPYSMPSCEVGMEQLAKRNYWKFLTLRGSVWSLKGDNDLNSYNHILRHHPDQRPLSRLEHRWVNELL